MEDVTNHCNTDYYAAWVRTKCLASFSSRQYNFNLQIPRLKVSSTPLGKRHEYERGGAGIFVKAGLLRELELYRVTPKDDLLWLEMFRSPEFHEYKSIR